MARPAAFGPLLPARGLSGQLWIGSGFGDDNGGLRTVAGAEGELGCSDVPGYEGGKTLAGEGAKDGKGKVAKGKVASRRRGLDGRVLGDRVVREEEKAVDVDDGTDDHLHRSSSTVSKALKPAGAHEKGAGDTDHADIQSIQEGAEIAGKVVLLSRGGCGFLEKVKWVQRRGGIALIVGDDTRGGPLIQMYARGDTSNVTIPSVFTSHTTAHLLSSLIPPGIYIEDTIDENGNPAVKAQQPKKPKKGKKPGKHAPGPAKPTTTPKTHTPLATPPKKVPEPAQKPAPEKGKTSWFSSLFSSSKSDEAAKKGMLNWVLADEFDETDDSRKASAPKVAGGERSSKTSGKGKGSPKATADDDFVIGVHDWRDPDLVGHPDPKDAKATKGQAKTAEKAKKTAVERDGSGADVDSKKTSPPVPKPSSDLRGGSITPSSGKYPDGAPKKPDDKATKKEPEDKVTESGLLHKLFGDDDDVAEPFDTTYTDAEDEDIGTEDDLDAHEGLWVTLTQTNGATPFFDTLLVLVVSPLVTLTVVYALLLLRSRIRRRRWRAPKSVVERLPVRTYQTVASSPGSASRQPSPTSSSPSTPLLQQQQGGSTPSRPRPRSRTTSGIPEPGNLSRSNSSNLSGNLEIGGQRGSVRDGREGKEHEKAHVASEWKKYMGKQVECVVCLEEYVDGVSRVMSLPCGHEFHVDCMYVSSGISFTSYSIPCISPSSTFIFPFIFSLPYSSQQMQITNPTKLTHPSEPLG
jgi:hypothetical protein